MTESAVKGMKELSDKLVKLGVEMGVKTLRQSTRNAMNVAKREAKLRIPVGERPHRTYKGRLVGPGFAQRNLTVVSRKRGAKGFAQLGVKREAFYATQFVELGTRKQSARPWLIPAFESSRPRVEEKLATELKRKIDKLTK